jgi:hypothetical protein
MTSTIVFNLPPVPTVVSDADGRNVPDLSTTDFHVFRYDLVSLPYLLMISSTQCQKAISILHRECKP